MPKVLLLVNVGYDGVMNAAGSTIEVSKETASEWRKRGMCRPLAQGEPPAAAPIAPETDKQEKSDKGAPQTTGRAE